MTYLHISKLILVIMLCNNHTTLPRYVINTLGLEVIIVSLQIAGWL